ncbi:MAG: hypothetical protein HY909_06170 [Deltaproteobacteria bacterium]|nr:hypothetical protein [Deltaproteobacteria bacterium]
MRAPRRWPWPWIGALGGALGGALDFALFTWLAPELGRWNTSALAAVFLANMAVLGYALGRLHEARRRARADAETIRAQLDTLERTGRAAAQAEKLAALGRVAAGIAHEVRNPLGVLRASASLIDEDLTEGQPEARKACQFIVGECDRLDRLVGALLVFARPTRAQSRTFSLGEAVERTLRLSGPAVGRSGPEVTSEVREPSPAVEGDVELVQQVLFGLVLNAAEAGARRVTLRAGVDKNSAFVEVVDDGPGVPEADAERIFEPFFTTKETGTGLGLPTAARIAEAHGGSLTLRPGSARGACFRLALPSAEAP